LELLIEVNDNDILNQEIEKLIKESQELLSIIVASIITARKNSN
jgi:hypothetical protein